MAEEPPSSPPNGGWGSVEEELAYYKSQYETLESELQEFQASSKELEAELERDVEESEKREQKLQEKLEGLRYEVDEWQTKYKQSKTEANNAQNTLQKEITELRDSQRTLQLKLRDIEVANDDFERQTRNQTSSLEDLESKYNVAIERSVMLEEEIKIGEQEREGLRIDNQRLKDQHSDLKIEAEIVQEKLRHAEQMIQTLNERKSSHFLSTETLRPRSPVSETSTSATTLSSPTTSTPPSKADTAITEQTPPSPPLSETSAPVKKVPSTPLPARKGSIQIDPTTTPRPGFYQQRPPRHSRGPSIPLSKSTSGTNGRTTPSIRTTAPPSKMPRSSIGGNAGGLPRSGSLYQIRGLIGKMQKLEERVHSARSRLPAPTSTPPRASPRNGSALGHHIPNTVTVRSNRKRASGASTASSMNGIGDTGGVSRLSFGIPAGSRDTSNSRPSSRASISSASGIQRPGSRSSTRTPLGHYSTSSISGGIPRPRSSMSGQFGHSHSQSLSMSSSVRERDTDGDANSDGMSTPLARRTTFDKTGIPTPSGLPRRQSAGRRTSSGLEGDMGPPERPGRSRKLSEVGESY